MRSRGAVDGNRELVAAETPDEPVAAGGRLQPARDLGQQSGARDVPEVITEVLESIELDERAAPCAAEARRDGWPAAPGSSSG